MLEGKDSQEMRRKLARPTKMWKLWARGCPKFDEPRPESLPKRDGVIVVLKRKDSTVCDTFVFPFFAKLESAKIS